jgi:hypothetical protein
MRMTDWDSIFEKVYPIPGASQEDIDMFVSSVLAPLTENEIVEINAGQRNPFPPSHSLYNSYRPFDPRQWILPTLPLPFSYLNFLAWSNGPECVNGERSFGFLSTHEVRDYLLAYHIPEYMPLALPFALNGGGVFYLFDMRQKTEDGEYPIVVSHAGNLDWEDARFIAVSLVEACCGQTDIEDILYGE